MTSLASRIPSPISRTPGLGARSAALLLLFSLSAIVGCGQADPPQVAVFPVSGKVKLSDGSVPEGGRVVFYAVTRTEALPAGISPMAIIEKDGSFKVGTYAKGDGAPPGDYTATVEWFKVVTTPEESFNGPNVLPKDYASPTATPVKVTVSGPTEVPTIEIESKKK